MVLDRLLGGGGKVFFAKQRCRGKRMCHQLARKWTGHGRYVVVDPYGLFHGRTSPLSMPRAAG